MHGARRKENFCSDVFLFHEMAFIGFPVYLRNNTFCPGL